VVQITFSLFDMLKAKCLRSAMIEGTVLERGNKLFFNFTTKLKVKSPLYIIAQMVYVRLTTHDALDTFRFERMSNYINAHSKLTVTLHQSIF